MNGTRIAIVGICAVVFAAAPVASGDFYVRADAYRSYVSGGSNGVYQNSTTERTLATDYDDAGESDPQSIVVSADARATDATAVGVRATASDGGPNTGWRAFGNTEASEQIYLTSTALGTIEIPLNFTAALQIPTTDDPSSSTVSFSAMIRVLETGSWTTLASWGGSAEISNNGNTGPQLTLNNLPPECSYSFADGLYSVGGSTTLEAPIEYVNGTYQIWTQVYGYAWVNRWNATPASSSMDSYGSLAFADEGGDEAFLWDVVDGTGAFYDQDDPSRMFPEPATVALLLLLGAPALLRQRRRARP